MTIRKITFRALPTIFGAIVFLYGAVLHAYAAPVLFHLHGWANVLESALAGAFSASLILLYRRAIIEKTLREFIGSAKEPPAIHWATLEGGPAPLKEGGSVFITPKGAVDIYLEDMKRARRVYLDELRDNDPQAYINKIREECEEVGYPGVTSALYDEGSDQYFNLFGQKLKRPEEYEPDNDGRYY